MEIIERYYLYILYLLGKAGLKVKTTQTKMSSYPIEYIPTVQYFSNTALISSIAIYS